MMKDDIISLIEKDLGLDPLHVADEELGMNGAVYYEESFTGDK